MKREFLEQLGLEKESIDKIMAEHGKTVTKLTQEKDTLQTQLDTTKGTLETANKQIKSYQDMDIETIKKSAEDWEKTAKQAQKDAEAKVKEMEKEFAIKEVANGISFASELAKKAFIAEFKAKDFKFVEGKFEGAEAYVEELKKADPAAFGTVDLDGAGPAGGASGADGEIPAAMLDAAFGIAAE